VRRLDWIRVLAVAILAAGVSFVGPGGYAFAAAPGRLAQQVRDGKDDLPLATRAAPSTTRLALRPRSTSADHHGGRLLAAALTERADSGALCSETLSAEAPRATPRRGPTALRSSRGPPEA
jgi:hypothetical protein